MLLNLALSLYILSVVMSYTLEKASEPPCKDSSQLWFGVWGFRIFRGFTVFRVWALEFGDSGFESLGFMDFRV